jgi:hypothetical protein
MTVSKLVPKADANGFISPALLRGAVTGNFRNMAFQGAGDLGELAQIGQTFLKQPPDSYTASRLKDLILPAGAAGLGGGLEFAMHNPDVALKTLGSGAAGYLAQKAYAGLRQARLGPGAANRLIGGSYLPGPISQQLGTTFDAINNLTRPAQVPAFALGGNALLGSRPGAQ